MEPVTWVVEASAFSPAYSTFCEAIDRLGHRRLEWNDDWWQNGNFPNLQNTKVVFHGSLGNADRLVREGHWQSGVFCSTQAFFCTQWYERASKWLIHKEWLTTTVAKLNNSPSKIADRLTHNGRVFIRPDSPLKPFSGRVCAVNKITLSALDYGFYYEDKDTPIVVAPVESVGDEWRFVVVDRKVVAGSGYLASGRKAQSTHTDRSWNYAAQIAEQFEPPERVYVLDLCHVDGELRMVEINPFSGADLYGCDPEGVINAVSRVIRS